MFILAIDQGTTGTTAAIFDKNANLVKKTYRPVRQIYPQPSWVEHDPEDIWQTVVDTVDELMFDFSGKIAAIGITNQRETTIIWDRITGKPIYNAIVWQCRRTSAYCEQLKEHQDFIRNHTGLPVDAYFSGTKIKWLLENVKNVKRDNLLFGTIDSWLIWKLTNGKVHATDYTNASRTMIYNIVEKKWDSDILKLLKIPSSILPQVKKSADDFGKVESLNRIVGIPILGVAGDQQAALFGQKCFKKGQIKNTYGTGCFLVMNMGYDLIYSKNGLLSTLAINGECKPCYALEGSIFIAGAVVQWLRDELQIIHTSSESEAAASSVDNNGGTYFVPAFVGLGAPYWDPEIRGIIVGLTRGTNRNHIIRAALESIAYQTHDVLAIMKNETGLKINSLVVDGGATDNKFLMQFQSDIINLPIIKPKMAETTSLGAAFLAGLKSGLWNNVEEIKNLNSPIEIYQAKMDSISRQQLLKGWRKSLRQACAK